MQSPLQLMEALRRGLDMFQGAAEEGREKSLTVSLDYSFAKLSERARQHLPFLALFSERVNADWLHHISSNPDDEYGQAYQAVFGENLQKPDWLIILNEAAAAGILEHLGETYYKIHPALPWYLRQRLISPPVRLGINSEANSASRLKTTENRAISPLERTSAMSLGFEPQAVDDIRLKIEALEKKLLFFYAGLAVRYKQQLIGNAELAVFILQVEEPNLLQNLRLAEQQQSWQYAQAILQALGEVYERLGRKPEFKSLRQRALNQIGIHLAAAKAKGQDALDFWMYLRGVDANEAVAVAKLEEAEASHQEILAELTALNDPSVNNKIGVAYHNLGRVAEEQRRFDEAISFYQKALKIHEDAGDLHKAAGVYHQLGMVAQEQRQFDEAIAYYQKALKIFVDAGDLHRAASVYHQLGVVAQEQRRFEEAIAFYQKALKIFVDAGDLHNAASDYHNLGVVAQEQRQFDEAIAFYQKALKIREDARDLHNAASDYHQLGVVAQEQRQFDEAIAFYLKALQIYDKFKAWRYASWCLTKIGKSLKAQENLTEASKVYISVLARDVEHNQERINSDIRDLGRMLKALGESEFETVWREVTGGECTAEVRSDIWAASEENEE